MPADLTNRTYLTWVAKNKYTFMLVILIVGNVYQYMDRKVLEQQYREDRKDFEDQIGRITKESIDYERQRSEKFELLLDNLSKPK